MTGPGPLPLDKLARRNAKAKETFNLPASEDLQAAYDASIGGGLQRVRVYIFLTCLAWRTKKASLSSGKGKEGVLWYDDIQRVELKEPALHPKIVSITLQDGTEVSFQGFDSTSTVCTYIRFRKDQHAKRKSGLPLESGRGGALEAEDYSEVAGPPPAEPHELPPVASSSSAPTSPSTPRHEPATVDDTTSLAGSVAGGSVAGSVDGSRKGSKSGKISRHLSFTSLFRSHSARRADRAAAAGTLTPSASFRGPWAGDGLSPHGSFASSASGAGEGPTSAPASLRGKPKYARSLSVQALGRTPGVASTHDATDDAYGAPPAAGAPLSGTLFPVMTAPPSPERPPAPAPAAPPPPPPPPGPPPSPSRKPPAPPSPSRKPAPAPAPPASPSRKAAAAPSSSPGPPPSPFRGFNFASASSAPSSQRPEPAPPAPADPSSSRGPPPAPPAGSGLGRTPSAPSPRLPRISEGSADAPPAPPEPAPPAAGPSTPARVRSEAAPGASPAASPPSRSVYRGPNASAALAGPGRPPAGGDSAAAIPRTRFVLDDATPFSASALLAKFRACANLVPAGPEGGGSEVPGMALVAALRELAKLLDRVPSPTARVKRDMLAKTDVLYHVFHDAGASVPTPLGDLATDGINCVTVQALARVELAHGTARRAESGTRCAVWMTRALAFVDAFVDRLADESRGEVSGFQAAVGAYEASLAPHHPPLVRLFVVPPMLAMLPGSRAALLALLGPLEGGAGVTLDEARTLQGYVAPVLDSLAGFFREHELDGTELPASILPSQVAALGASFFAAAASAASAVLPSAPLPPAAPAPPRPEPDQDAGPAPAP